MNNKEHERSPQIEESKQDPGEVSKEEIKEEIQTLRKAESTEAEENK